MAQGKDTVCRSKPAPDMPSPETSCSHSFRLLQAVRILSSLIRFPTPPFLQIGMQEVEEQTVYRWVKLINKEKIKLIRFGFVK
jgi:hypothetical protein